MLARECCTACLGDESERIHRVEKLQAGVPELPGIGNFAGALSSAPGQPVGRAERLRADSQPGPAPPRLMFSLDALAEQAVREVARGLPAGVAVALAC